MHTRKSLDCLEEAVDRNMDIKADSGEASEGREEGYTVNFTSVIIEIYMYHHEQNVGKNMNN